MLHYKVLSRDKMLFEIQIQYWEKKMSDFDIARRFVDLVLNSQPHREDLSFTKTGVKTLFEIVSAAGFDPQNIVLAKLTGDYFDDDGRPSGRTYPINSTCPYKVVGHNDYGTFCGTGWLDQAFSSVVSLERDAEDRDHIAEIVVTWIEKSRPLEPIRLTVEGDMLVECPPNAKDFGPRYFVEHTRDNMELSDTTAIHAICRGVIRRNRSSEMYDALRCPECGLRVSILYEIKTYGELRKYFKSEMDAIEGQAGPG